MQHAIKATMMSVSATVTYVTASVAVTPNSSVVISRVINSAPASPTPAPQIASRQSDNAARECEHDALGEQLG
jgi:hypothetical protein